MASFIVEAAGTSVCACLLRQSAPVTRSSSTIPIEPCRPAR